MKTGLEGTFVISWSQTELDGLGAAPLSAVQQGAVWSWRGDFVRVDGSNAVLRLERGEGDAMLRRRAARMVRKLVGAALTNSSDLESVETEEPMRDSCFVVSNGQNSYTVTVVHVEGAAPLLMFLDEVPPKGTDLWVVHQNLDLMLDDPNREASSGTICFTPGTLIDTPSGPRAIEALREGDLVQTKDNGAQEVQWIGSRRMTGARLFALPKLRPVRIKAGALGKGWPEKDLVVSPDHKMLVRGRVARALFNTPEVLVAARQLENGSTIRVDTQMREVTYMHLLMPRHEILFADGVETESFHPADASLSAMVERDRSRLLGLNPELEARPYIYGEHARRQLSASEAAILRHEAA